MLQQPQRLRTYRVEKRFFMDQVLYAVVGDSHANELDAHAERALLNAISPVMDTMRDRLPGGVTMGSVAPTVEVEPKKESVTVPVDRMLKSPWESPTEPKEESVTVPTDRMGEVVYALALAKENIHELLVLHDAATGRQTRKDAAWAAMLEREIALVTNLRQDLLNAGGPSLAEAEERASRNIHGV